jgi:N6-L-threonylcarbamoyladenine synthase
MKLGYPGGIFISKIADQFRNKNKNCKQEFNLPKPLINSKVYNFSFSGLKTAVLYLVQRLKKEKKFNKKITGRICFEAEEVITEVLVNKTLKLARDISAKTIMISGGVSANQRLRSKFVERINKEFDFICPDKLMSTDNAAMIAVAGYYEYLKDKKDNCLIMEVDSNSQINY